MFHDVAIEYDIKVVSGSTLPTNRRHVKYLYANVQMGLIDQASKNRNRYRWSLRTFRSNETDGTTNTNDSRKLRGQRRSSNRYA